MTLQVNVVNIGAADPETSKRFYEALGFRAVQGSDGSIHVQLGSTTLAVCEWDTLAARAGEEPRSVGFRGCALSAIFGTAAEVDTVMTAARRAAAKVTKPARSAMWGGYSGYFADPDGHLWKVASSSKPPRSRQRRQEAAARVQAQGETRPTSIAVTLGVDDVKATKQFYGDGLGCPVDKSFGAKFASFDLGEGSSTLGLYTRKGLANDAGVPVDGSGFRGITLSCLVDSSAQVDATIDEAERAGSLVTVAARRAASGSYSGSFRDPDGFVWNVVT